MTQTNKEKIEALKAKAEARLVIQSDRYEYDVNTNRIVKTTEEKTLWQGMKSGVANTIDDIKKAPMRRRALKAIADSALESIYQEIEDEKRARQAEKEQIKADKAAVKEAASKSKLDKIVENTVATA